MSVPWRNVPGGIELRLRVTPRSRHDEVTGIHRASDGSVSLAVKVRALADKGAANRAVIETLAAALGISKSRLALVSGATSRGKVVVVAGEPKDLEPALAGLLVEGKKD